MSFSYRVQCEQSCRVTIERGAFGRLPELVRALAPDSRVFVVTDTQVADLYLPKLLARFTAAGLPPLGVATFPAGDQSKCLASATAAWDRLLECGFARRDVIVAFGGGMVIDLAGFVAASFMRGVPYVNAPTDLLAQVDAGLGGKVAVNHGNAKNTIGAFHHPLGVIADPELLRTLPDRPFCAGVAEIVKVALIASPSLFELVAGRSCATLRADEARLDEALSAAVDHKLALVLADPFERELSRTLNFGHTVGHALEAVVPPDRLLHGEAIAWGIALACHLSRGRQLCSDSCAAQILACLAGYGLAADPPAVTATELWDRLMQINLIRGRRTRWVLPLQIGTVTIVDDVSSDEFARAWTALQHG